jgi:CDP-glucose 4,6-dehydratase
MTILGGEFERRKVLITGHTGFKGSWLTLFLEMLGAEVSGFSLPPAEGSHFEYLDLAATSHFGDIQDGNRLRRVMSDVKPEVVFHLAAQPLVRESYRAPIGTWMTNVIGTQNVLEAIRLTPSVRAAVCITTDKVYRNNERHLPFEEHDPLGGHDPYSASKAACEILVDSYRLSFFNELHHPLLASARAGNVIGGGDWAVDRLIPDLVRAMMVGEPATIRHPNAVRPWQHVIDCLAAYLLIARNLLYGNRAFARAWNIGPRATDTLSVSGVIHQLQEFLPQVSYAVTGNDGFHEAQYLALDSGALREVGGWQSVWSAREAVEKTADWYSTFTTSGGVRSADDIRSFVNDAQQRQCDWIV